ncbi:MAG: hypothetical protein MUC48_11060 [Leptolyngbya sp. Prado105]|jgi:hypothetical protein|nr:hypothetical protein [Leptolyngbya sp. Prado105]
MDSLPLLGNSISDLFAEVSNTGKMTVSDRQTLESARLDPATTEEEKQAISRLLHAVRLDRIQVVEETHV